MNNEWIIPEQELLIKQSLEKPVGTFIVSSSGAKQNEAMETLLKLAKTYIEKDDVKIENLTENTDRSLSNVLKRDPDVVIMDEIKDESSIKAMSTLALSGHKVLTTVSSSSAFSIVQRLKALGLSNGDIGSPDFINAVLHQIGFDMLTEDCSMSFSEYKESSQADIKIIECVNDLFMPDEIQNIRFRKAGKHSKSGEIIYITELFQFNDEVRKEIRTGNIDEAYRLHEKQSSVSFDSNGSMQFTGKENSKIVAFEAVKKGLCDIREVDNILSIIKR